MASLKLENKNSEPATFGLVRWFSTFRAKKQIWQPWSIAFSKNTFLFPNAAYSGRLWVEMPFIRHSMSKKLVVGLVEMTIFTTCVLQYIGQLQIKVVGSLQSMCTQFSLREHATWPMRVSGNYQKLSLKELWCHWSTCVAGTNYSRESI